MKSTGVMTTQTNQPSQKKKREKKYRMKKVAKNQQTKPRRVEEKTEEKAINTRQRMIYFYIDFNERNETPTNQPTHTGKGNIQTADKKTAPNQELNSRSRSIVFIINCWSGKFVYTCIYTKTLNRFTEK